MNDCTTCRVTAKDYAERESVWECSHVDCPLRRKAWSERPTPAQLFKGPWRTSTDGRAVPLDVQIKAGGAS